MGAITSAVIGLGTAVYATKSAKKQQKAAVAEAQRQETVAQEFAEKQMENLDPFAPYRAEYAQKLSNLANDPSSIEDTSVYKARMKAAERVLAAQGYTGSGNALVAAADAGATAYQQEFDNLAMLSGAAQGQGARSSAYGTAAGQQQGNYATSSGNVRDTGNSYLSGIAGIGNNLANLATVWKSGSTPPPVSIASPGSIGGFGNNVGNFTSGNWGG